MSAGNNARLGIALMIAVSVVFAGQDGISRHLAGEYNVYMVVTVLSFVELRLAKSGKPVTL